MTAAALLSLSLAAVSASAAFAGTWRKNPVGEGWFYEYGNGYVAVGWNWIDGDGDGVSESYYFDNNGWLLTATVTPDGFVVNADGQWVLNGVIQRQGGGQDTAAAAAASRAGTGGAGAGGTAPESGGNGGTQGSGGDGGGSGLAERHPLLGGTVGNSMPASAVQEQAIAAAAGTQAAAAPQAAAAGAQQAYPASDSGGRPELVERARSFVGWLPYVYGGYSLTGGTDCSGFTKLLYAEIGIDIPRSTPEQCAAGTRISASEVQPGDLIYWSNSSGRIYHVGIYSGNGKFIHESNSARGFVFEDNLHDMHTPCAYVRF